MADRDLMAVAHEVLDGFNAGDRARYRATFAPDGVYDEIGTQRRVTGADAWVECWEAWRKAMPDVTGTLVNAVVGGDTVVLEVTWAGTHTGPLVGPGGTIPPSGKRQVTRAALVCRFRGNTIQECHHYFDLLALLQQLGAAPG